MHAAVSIVTLPCLCWGVRSIFSRCWAPLYPLLQLFGGQLLFLGGFSPDTRVQEGGAPSLDRSPPCATPTQVLFLSGVTTSTPRARSFTHTKAPAPFAHESTVTVLPLLIQPPRFDAFLSLRARPFLPPLPSLFALPPFVLPVRDGAGCSCGDLRGSVEDGSLTRHDGVGNGSQARPVLFPERVAVDAAPSGIPRRMIFF